MNRSQLDKIEQSCRDAKTDLINEVIQTCGEMQNLFDRIEAKMNVMFLKRRMEIEWNLYDKELFVLDERMCHLAHKLILSVVHGY